MNGGMMKNRVESFEDLVVWKESVRLSIEVYQLLKDSKDFGLRDQIQRSSVSIPSNIAEGYERKSNKELMRFLYIAKGSCGELRTQIYIAMEIGTIPKDVAKKMIEKTKSISSMLHGLIKTRKENFQ